MSDLNKSSNLYTTGEIAKLCGVTVRTVQYYDSRNILVPSQFTEGGRRLYSEEDLQRMKIICFLRGLDLPISSIEQLLSEEHPENVISLLLEQQEQLLQTEIEERLNKLNKLEQLQRELKNVEHFSIESIGDVAYLMENKKKLRKVRSVVLAVGICVEIAEIGSIALWIAKGIWWPFVAWLVIGLVLCVWVSHYYFKNVAYICPECHKVFKPGFREAFWAGHTPTTRKLTCTGCGHKGFCVETYGGEEA